MNLTFMVVDSFGKVHKVICDCYELTEMSASFYTKHQAILLARFRNYSSVVRVLV